MLIQNHNRHTVTLRDFAFGSGQVLPELRLNVLTLGEKRTDAAGRVANAALLIHNTTGTAETFLQPSLGGELFGAGQPLDLARWFVVIPDMIGFGASSKPSDGLRASFPNYRYDDMVRATHILLTEHLGIAHLRVVLGISAGGMLAWLFGVRHPGFADALIPIASQPTAMSGRNWMQRRISIEAIRNDPEWNGGNYTKNPSRYAITAPLSALFTQSAVRLQEAAPTREKADAEYRKLVERSRAGDANDRLYQVEASMDYDPSAELEKIRARVLAINFEDDELNPPRLGVMEPAIARIPGAKFVLIPAGPGTNGHYSNQLAKLWASHVGEFLATLREPVG
jgi:homoserine O-acetyltransferase